MHRDINIRVLWSFSQPRGYTLVRASHGTRVRVHSRPRVRFNREPPSPSFLLLLLFRRDTKNSTRFEKFRGGLLLGWDKERKESFRQVLGIIRVIVSQGLYGSERPVRGKGEQRRGLVMVSPAR